VIIRQMDIKDYEELLKLWEHKPDIGDGQIDSRDKFEKFLRRNSSYNLVCQHKNQIIGSILCGSDGQSAYIYHLAIREDYRLKGIESDMINELIRKLSIDGVKECRLFVMDDNYDEQDFWISEGWKQNRDMIVFSRKLKASN